MKNKQDIQSQYDDRQIAIYKVGVKNIVYPIVVEDRANQAQHTVATIDMYVSLPHHHRGTHMSRFLELLNKYHGDLLINRLPDFLAEIKKALQADNAYIEIKFPYFINKKAPVSQIKSLMSYNCVFNASLEGDAFQLEIGVEVPVTSLCPCSKEISEYGAHNQRSHLSVRLRYLDFIWLEEIIEMAESAASCEIYSLLKREDEKYVTEKAYNRPRFVEDVVREMAILLGKDQRIKSWHIESENFESIHNHSAYACINNEINNDKNK